MYVYLIVQHLDQVQHPHDYSTVCAAPEAVGVAEEGAAAVKLPLRHPRLPQRPVPLHPVRAYHSGNQVNMTLLGMTLLGFQASGKWLRNVQMSHTSFSEPYS